MTKSLENGRGSMRSDKAVGNGSYSRLSKDNPIYPKIKASKVQNGFEVFAFGKTYVFGEDDHRGLLGFITEWVSRVSGSGSKKNVESANISAIKEVQENK